MLAKERAKAGTAMCVCVRAKAHNQPRRCDARSAFSARVLAALMHQPAASWFPHAPAACRPLRKSAKGARPAGNSFCSRLGGRRWLGRPCFGRCRFCLREWLLLRHSHTGSTLLKIMANDPAPSLIARTRPASSSRQHLIFARVTALQRGRFFPVSVSVSVSGAA